MFKCKICSFTCNTKGKMMEHKMSTHPTSLPTSPQRKRRRVEDGSSGSISGGHSRKPRLSGNNDALRGSSSSSGRGLTSGGEGDRDKMPPPWPAGGSGPANTTPVSQDDDDEIQFLGEVKKNPISPSKLRKVRVKTEKADEPRRVEVAGGGMSGVFGRKTNAPPVVEQEKSTSELAPEETNRA
jgi:hypothetical protein